LDSIQPVLGVIGIILVILAAVGSAAAYLRASYAKATVTTLGESNAALKEQVEVLKLERDEDDRQRELLAEKHRADQVTWDTRLAAVERENTTLREVVQGKADVERLVMLIQDHHHDVLEDRRAFHVEWRVEIDKMHAAQTATVQANAVTTKTLGEVNVSLGQVKGMLTRMVQTATVAP